MGNLKPYHLMHCLNPLKGYDYENEWDNVWNKVGTENICPYLVWKIEEVTVAPPWAETQFYLLCNFLVHTHGKWSYKWFQWPWQNGFLCCFTTAWVISSFLLLGKKINILSVFTAVLLLCRTIFISTTVSFFERILFSELTIL